MTEVHFGDALTDRYRWMENPKDRDWLAFLRGQNAHTRALLDGLPQRECPAEARPGAQRRRGLDARSAARRRADLFRAATVRRRQLQALRSRGRPHAPARRSHGPGPRRRPCVPGLVARVAGRRSRRLRPFRKRRREFDPAHSFSRRRPRSARAHRQHPRLHAAVGRRRIGIFLQSAHRRAGHAAAISGRAVAFPPAGRRSRRRSGPGPAWASPARCVRAFAEPDDLHPPGVRPCRAVPQGHPRRGDGVRRAGFGRAAGADDVDAGRCARRSGDGGRHPRPRSLPAVVP